MQSVEYISIFCQKNLFFWRQLSHLLDIFEKILFKRENVALLSLEPCSTAVCQAKDLLRAAHSFYCKEMWGDIRGVQRHFDFWDKYVNTLIYMAGKSSYFSLTVLTEYNDLYQSTLYKSKKRHRNSNAYSKSSRKAFKSTFISVCRR